MGIFYNNSINESIDTVESILIDIQEMNQNWDYMMESVGVDDFLYINESGNISNIINKAKKFFKDLFNNIRKFLSLAKNKILGKAEKMNNKMKKDNESMASNLKKDYDQMQKVMKATITLKVFDFDGSIYTFTSDKHFSKLKSISIDLFASNEEIKEVLGKLPDVESIRYEVINNNLNGSYTEEEYRKELFKLLRNGQSEPHDKKFNISDAESGISGHKGSEITIKSLNRRIAVFTHQIESDEDELNYVIKNIEGMKDRNIDINIINKLISKAKEIINVNLTIYNESTKALNDELNQIAMIHNSLQRAYKNVTENLDSEPAAESALASVNLL